MSNWIGSQEVTSLALQARAELERRRRASARSSILDFIPRVTPRWRRPSHLRRLTETIERAEREEVRVLLSVPPRHSKTETILHAIAWWLARHPEQIVAYVTYSDRLTTNKSRLAQQYALRAGVKLVSRSLNEWRTPEGGGAKFTSIGGGFTGDGCNILIIDDPHKDRAEAESLLLRDGVESWLRGTAYTRLEPGGSIVVCHTRWHPDDLIGRLRCDPDESWEQIILPAINDGSDPTRAAGEALWPWRWPADALEKKRRGVSEYEWFSQYQCQPRSRGATLFRDVTYFDELPKAEMARYGFRIAIGIDLSYTSKTYSDYSVAVVLLWCHGRLYVIHVERMQVDAPRFGGTLVALQARFPGSRTFGFIGGTEIGVVDFLRKHGVKLDVEAAHADKFVRAQSVSAAWNQGHVLVARNRPWTEAFVSELTEFTGVKDRHDDQVDALAGGHHVFVEASKRGRNSKTRDQAAQ